MVCLGCCTKVPQDTKSNYDDSISGQNQTHSPLILDDNMTTKTQATPMILKLAKGAIAFIRGHVTSTGEEAEPRCVKDRKFQTGTDIRTAEIRKDTEALNRVTVLDVIALLKARGVEGFEPTVLSAALQQMDAAVTARQEGTNKRTPSVTESVVIDTDGRDIIRAIQNQRSKTWNLQICNAAQLWSNFAGMTDDEIAEFKMWHSEEDEHRFNKNVTRAFKQHDRWLAEEGDKTQSLRDVIALINKVIPRKPSTARHFTLISSKGEITCTEIAIGGHRFSNPIDIVAAHRPDLLPLFGQ